MVPDPDLKVFAVSDMSTLDREHVRYLYFDLDNGEIFIKSNFPTVDPVELRKLGANLADLLGTQDYSRMLVKERDEKVWAWMESTYHSHEFNRTVPPGIVPAYDLRIYFRDELPSTFLSDHKEVDEKKFWNYFRQFGVENSGEENFFKDKPSDESLLGLVKRINARLGKERFYVVSFNPSGFWGIGNYKPLKEKQKQQLVKYGLIRQ